MASRQINFVVTPTLEKGFNHSSKQGRNDVPRSTRANWSMTHVTVLLISSQNSTPVL